MEFVIYMPGSVAVGFRIPTHVATALKHCTTDEVQAICRAATCELAARAVLSPTSLPARASDDKPPPERTPG